MITVIDETTNDTVAAGAAPSSSSSASAAMPQASTNSGSGTTTATQEQPSPIMDASIEAQTKKTNIKNPPVPLPDTSNLMSRLQMFLPQMKSANQELLSNPFPVPPSGMLGIGSDPVRLDANLKLDEDSDSDSDSDDDNEGSKSNNPLIREVGADDVPESAEKDEPSKMTPNDASDDAVPTIQLEFTLGDMSGNPLMKLLADDDDDDSDDSSDASNAGKDADDDHPMSAARKNAVVNLLRQPPSTATSSKNDSTFGSDEKKNNNNLVLLNSSIADGGSNKNTEKKRLITELS